MALVTGEWSVITISALGGAWPAPNPQIHGLAVDAIIAVSSILAFCEDDAVPGSRKQLAWYDTTNNVTVRSIFPSGALTVLSSPAQHVETLDGGNVQTYVHDAGGSLLWYSTTTTNIERLAVYSALKTYM